MISIKTFGMFVPIFGGLSSWVIGRFLLLEKFTMRSSIVLLLLGFLSSAIGLTIYFILSGLENFGLQIVSIIILWQLSLGVVAVEPSLIGTNTTANSSSCVKLSSNSED
jgi:hypothetical protein